MQVVFDEVAEDKLSEMWLDLGSTFRILQNIEGLGDVAVPDGRRDVQKHDGLQVLGHEH